jgi:hypothetical protein
MPLGTIVLASATVIESATTGGGVYSPISDLNSITRGSNRQIDTFPVFQRATAYSIPGAREVTLTLNGFLSKADTGQDMLRTAETGNTTVFIKVLPDGTNGQYQEFRVGSREWSAEAEGGLQAVSFECGAVGDPTTVGSGLTF